MTEVTSPRSALFLPSPPPLLSSASPQQQTLVPRPFAKNLQTYRGLGLGLLCTLLAGSNPINEPITTSCQKLRETVSTIFLTTENRRNFILEAFSSLKAYSHRWSWHWCNQIPFPQASSSNVLECSRLERKEHEISYSQIITRDAMRGCYLVSFKCTTISTQILGHTSRILSPQLNDHNNVLWP